MKDHPGFLGIVCNGHFHEFTAEGEGIVVNRTSYDPPRRGVVRDENRQWDVGRGVCQNRLEGRSGEIKRLIINMPPRSLKSISASVAFPAFVLGRDPTSRFICVSYSGDLAKSIPMTSAPWSKRPGIGPPFPPRGSGHTRTQRARSNSPRAASGWRHLSGAH